MHRLSETSQVPMKTSWFWATSNTMMRSRLTRETRLLLLWVRSVVPCFSLWVLCCIGKVMLAQQCRPHHRRRPPLTYVTNLMDPPQLPQRMAAWGNLLSWLEILSWNVWYYRASFFPFYVFRSLWNHFPFSFLFYLIFRVLSFFQCLWGMLCYIWI